jgi:hypothetical protein
MLFPVLSSTLSDLFSALWHATIWRKKQNLVIHLAPVKRAPDHPPIFADESKGQRSKAIERGFSRKRPYEI